MNVTKEPPKEINILGEIKMRRRYVSRAFDCHLKIERLKKQAIQKDLDKKREKRGVENDINGRTYIETTKS